MSASHNPDEGRVQCVDTADPCNRASWRATALPRTCATCFLGTRRPDGAGGHEAANETPRRGIFFAIKQQSGYLRTFNRSLGDDDAALGEDQLDVAQAGAGQVLQPDGMADDLRLKSSGDGFP